MGAGQLGRSGRDPRGVGVSYERGTPPGGGCFPQESSSGENGDLPRRENVS